MACLKATKPNAAYVCLDFNNFSQGTLTKVEIQYEVPRQYQVAFTSTQGQFQKNLFSLPSLSMKNSVGTHFAFYYYYFISNFFFFFFFPYRTQTTHVLEVKLDFQQPPSAVSGDISFIEPRGSRRTLPFFFSLKITDFLLPLRINIAAFGPKWLAFTQESKIVVDSPVTPNLVEITKMLCEGLRMHQVESKGMTTILVKSH